MDANEQKHTPAEIKDAADAARKEAATSSDTLADLEATEKSSPDAADTSETAPAPDGTPDPDRSSTADSHAAGDPM